MEQHDLLDCPLDLEYSILITQDSFEFSPQILSMIESLELSCESLKDTFSSPFHNIQGHSFYTCRHFIPGGQLVCLFPIDKLIQLYHRPLTTCGKVLYSIHISEVGKIMASYPVPLDRKNLLECIFNQDIALLCQTLSIVAKRRQKRILNVRWLEKTQLDIPTESLESYHQSVTLTILPVDSFEKTIQFHVLIQMKEPDASLGLFSSLYYLFKKI
jgi:hypothetical protein